MIYVFVRLDLNLDLEIKLLSNHKVLLQKLKTKINRSIPSSI